MRHVLQEIVMTGTPQEVKGTGIDKYTATMLLTVLDKLNEENQQKFLQRPLNEMVAIAYKILTN